MHSIFKQGGGRRMSEKKLQMKRYAIYVGVVSGLLRPKSLTSVETKGYGVFR